MEIIIDPVYGNMARENRIINDIDNTSDYSSSPISRMPANKMHF